MQANIKDDSAFEILLLSSAITIYNPLGNFIGGNVGFVAGSRTKIEKTTSKLFA